MTAVDVKLVRRLEEFAARAWPAARVEELDGWRLRADDGVTRRANSVLANTSADRLPLAEKLARVEQFYARERLPARYQLCPASLPPDLDGMLAARGYRAVAPTAVQVAPLAAVRAAALSGLADRARVADRLEDGWFATYCRADGFRGAEAERRGGILRRIARPTGYALLELDGQIAAVGLGVAEGDWVGLFCMATCPEFRRRGAATAVLHALAHWGERHGAAHAYLQVMDDNAPARGLYTRAGFRTLYHYHYREAAGPIFQES
jgi:ribosomal protein S18 acetylase RimI-like enzyme